MALILIKPSHPASRSDGRQISGIAGLQNEEVESEFNQVEPWSNQAQPELKQFQSKLNQFEPI